MSSPEWDELREAIGIFATYISMVEAHLECCDRESPGDNAVVTQFMGSGASCLLTVGDFRRLRSALAALEGE